MIYWCVCETALSWGTKETMIRYKLGKNSGSFIPKDQHSFKPCQTETHLIGGYLRMRVCAYASRDVRSDILSVAVY